MKTVTANLLAHIQGEVTTIATCWKVTRTDGEVFTFTDHLSDLVVSGLTYIAASGYTASAVESSGDLTVDNLDVQAFLDSEQVDETDLLAGRWDHATIEIFRVNYESVADGTIKMRKGTLGEITVLNGRYFAELRGLTQPLQQTRGRIYSRRCDADLGDARCGINLATITVNGAVLLVTSRSVFTATGFSSGAPSDWFNDGLMTFTSGLNSGISREVKRWVEPASSFELKLPFPYNVTSGETFSVYPGCDLNLSTCLTKFNNVVNFRGFPYIPGRDAVVQYPNAPAG